MSNKDLIRQYLGMGHVIKSKFFDRLTPNQFKTYVRALFMRRKNKFLYGEELRKLVEVDKTMALDYLYGRINNKEGFSKDDLEVLYKLDREKFISHYLMNIEHFDDLHDSIYFDEIVELGLSNPDVVNNISRGGYHSLLKEYKDPKKVYELFRNKYPIDDNYIIRFLQSSKNPIEVYDIFNRETADEIIYDHLKDYGVYGVSDIIYHSPNVEDANRVIVNNKYFRENMDLDILIGVLSQAKSPIKLLKELGDKAISLVDDIKNNRQALRLAEYSVNPSEYLKIFGEIGIDYVNNLDFEDKLDLINKYMPQSKVDNILKMLPNNGDDFRRELLNKDKFFELLKYVRYPQVVKNILGDDKVKEIMDTVEVDEGYNVYMDADNKDEVADFFMDYDYPNYRYY